MFVPPIQNRFGGKVTVNVSGVENKQPYLSRCMMRSMVFCFHLFDYSSFSFFSFSCLTKVSKGGYLQSCVFLKDDRAFFRFARVRGLPVDFEQIICLSAIIFCHGYTKNSSSLRQFKKQATLPLWLAIKGVFKVPSKNALSSSELGLTLKSPCSLTKDLMRAICWSVN